MRRVGIVGSGVMGQGIAQIAAQAGCRVQLFDNREGAAAAAAEQLRATFAKLADKGRLSAEQAAAATAGVAPAAALAELADCELVVEAIVEDLAAKRALFAQLEGVVGPGAILATNTSSLSVTAIAAGLQRPQRVAGFHFFNPVPLMKVVEVIDGLLTEPAVGDTLLAVGQAWGHTAVRAQDTPGFIVNHAGRGYGTEALRLLAEGVADVATLDRILTDTAGFRMGPFTLMDLTALDVSHPVMESIYRQFFDEPRFRPQPLTRQMLTAGLVGRKKGRGFYAYEGGSQQWPAEPDVPGREALPASVWVSRQAPAELQALVAQLAETAGITFDDDDRPAHDSLCLVAPLGDDATTCALHEGLDAERTVAVETLFDASKRRVLMTTPATSRAARDAAQALLASDGVPVSVLRDSYGFVAQRVVATIVNIACEIAQQRIATPADIDRAVTLGLGYPRGPLAWGDALGASTVLTILQRLQAHTGDPRYRPSPWLTRRASLGLSLLTEEV
ncbi:3-hydroxyacyl-CoA dehydrogenase [Aquabacterium sp.]|uniref:3-hydroxyacyl-CoA dehydrogenase n=1 Tax=Aquabacterium sp. TaxID=1872578 RepID=UPI0035B336DF